VTGRTLLVTAILAGIPAVVFLLAIIRKTGGLVAARMTAQAAFLVLFVFLMTQLVVPIEGAFALGGIFPADFFMRLSPLLALTAALAARTVAAGALVAGAVLASAFIAGRFFCGWVCPLGTNFDIFDRLFFSKRERPQSRDGALRGAKYVLLTGIVAAAAFGAQTAGWFDPMSLVTRLYAVSVLPAADKAVKAVIEKPLESESFRTSYPVIAQTLERTNSALKSAYVLYDTDHYYVQFGVFTGIFAVLLFAQLYQKRFWCRKLCPLGAMLGLAGKWRPLGVYLDRDKCVDCGKCRQICPTGAIQGKALSPEECTLCGSCVAPCPVGALRVSFRAPFAIEAAPKVLPGRREFLLAAASGIAAAPILAINTARKADQGRVIRPPGAQDEERFVEACVRCGECMKACPQNALHPTGFEEGLAGVWTPKVVPALGYCDYNCLSDGEAVGNFCATVCPTGAIKRLTPRQKHETRLGTAYFRTDKCIPYVERTQCSVCVEHCPVPEKALKNEIVEVVDLNTGQVKELERPYVDKTLCIGCGQCENVCPLKGEKGIRVEAVRSLV